MSNKLRLGIDINEVLRARSLQFDRYYYQEFGEEGIPDESYVYDFRNTYKWNAVNETINILRDNVPDDISPLEYIVDPKTCEAPIDALAFKKEINNLSADDVYDRFLYQDYLYEIFGAAPVMYKGMENDVLKFYQKYSDVIDIIIVSKEKKKSIPPTLFFISKLMLFSRKYIFTERSSEIWDEVDILITSDPELLYNFPADKKSIKVIRPYNIEMPSDLEILQINDLNDLKEGSVKGSLEENVLNKSNEFKKLINII